jgi:tetratricopeptide (TPR) repeat protein
MKTTLYLVLALATGLSCAWAQKGGSAGAPAGGGSRGSGGAPSSPTSPPGGGRNTPKGPVYSPLPQQNQTPAPPPRPIFLSGTVAVDDGSPLPGSVNIQAVCGVEQRTVAHTSARGDFSFQWGDHSGIFEDASQSGMSAAFGGLNGNLPRGRGGLSNPLANCELRADVPGYLSNRVPLFNYNSPDRIDVGTMIVHRMTGDEGTTVSVLSMKAPKNAKKSFHKGTDQFREHKYKDAAASFRKAVATYPEYADAWVSLGRAERQLGSREAAIHDFEKAIELDKKLLGPWQELGYMASDQSNWEQAAKYLDQAVRLDPMDSPLAWYVYAVANFNLMRYEIAERSIRTEMRLDQDRNPRAKFLLGLILMARNDMAGGAEALRSYLKAAPNAPDADVAKKQLLRAESLASR